jgi:benzaldehyde dehydrogenase (NAD)
MILADTAAWEGKLFQGTWRPAADTRAVISPSTGETLGRIGLASPADVGQSAGAAAGAQRDWAARPYEERSAVLRRAGDLFLGSSLEVERWLIREAGSTRDKAAHEVRFAARECYEAAALAGAPFGEVLRSAEPRLSIARRLPVGVVGVISPFNFPLILAMRSVAPALSLGNAVVLKPDPRTSVGGGIAIARVFEEAGLPAGVLQVLPGEAAAGAALIEDRNVPVITFTGSTGAGRKIGEAAARHFKRVHLELGGNNALIVCADADVGLAVAAGAFGSFNHQGQVCMASGRHLVADSVADEYVDRLALLADGLDVGDPAVSDVALGPLIDATQRDHVDELVRGSVAAGARVAAGGSYQALFYRPTVLDRIDPAMPAYAQETFGPVAPVLRFSTLDEAIELAADTEFGLSLGIITADVMTAYDLSARVSVGMVHINGQTIDDEPAAPFGGTGASGGGSRFGGTANLEAFTEIQWVTMQGRPPRYPWLAP